MWQWLGLVAFALAACVLAPARAANRAPSVFAEPPRHVRFVSRPYDWVRDGECTGERDRK